MGLFRRYHQNNLKAPVTGTHVDIKSLDHASSALAQVKLAIAPTTNEIHSPVHGEVLAVSQHAIKLQDLDGQDYWVHLSQTLDYLKAKIFDWQVRVGDSVSPMTLLGTLNLKAVQHAHSAVLVTQTALPAKATTSENATRMAMQY